jgi:diguanylate cyclase (GGDEF)-like protein
MVTSNEEQSSILIIDDSPTAIRLLADMLSDVAQITFATGGEAGLALARKNHPSLILLDVDMPLMDGYEVCHRLKADPDTCDIAVIFVTGESTMESEIRALNIGAVDFILKPLNQPVVRARVRTQLKLQQQAATLLRLANRDGLTGLFNRRYFDETVETEFQRLRRQKLPLGLAFIDIDHFKLFNDRFGHQQGDQCLKQVAQILNDATLRSGEFVARYGGEEFVAVLPHTTREQIIEYGDKLCRQIRNCSIIHPDSPVGVVTISVGVTSQVPGSNTSVHALIEQADQAVYQSKTGGRNRTSAWSPQDVQQACHGK